MSMTNVEETKKLSPGRRAAGGAGKALSWLLRLTAKGALLLIFISAGLFIGGFLQFTSTVAGAKIPVPAAPADGVVALTGGSDRIAHALDLLEMGMAKRLLISGVNPATSRDDIERINPDHTGQFDCCVDMESRAENTVGNAEETAKWVADNKYESIILVTSAYHMPRSLIEFRRQMTKTKITPHSVPLEELETAGWWRDPEILRFMLSEYLKYLGSRSREYIRPATLQSLRASVLGG